MLERGKGYEVSDADLRAILAADGCLPRGKRFDCRHCEAERGRGHGRMAIAILPVNPEHPDPIAFCHGCRRTWKADVKRSREELKEIEQKIQDRREIRRLAQRERLKGLEELDRLRKLERRAEAGGPTDKTWNTLSFTIRRQFEVERRLERIEKLEHRLLGKMTYDEWKLAGPPPDK